MVLVIPFPDLISGVRIAALGEIHLHIFFSLCNQTVLISRVSVSGNEIFFFPCRFFSFSLRRNLLSLHIRLALLLFLFSAAEICAYFASRP